MHLGTSPAARPGPHGFMAPAPLDEFPDGRTKRPLQPLLAMLAGTPTAPRRGRTAAAARLPPAKKKKKKKKKKKTGSPGFPLTCPRPRIRTISQCDDRLSR